MSAPDRDLVLAVRRGDRDAFGQLVLRHQRRLFGLVLMMVREPAAAEEVTQDAFVRAYVHIDRYEDQRPFYPWLASIAVRLAQNWLRTRGRVAARLSELEEQQENSGGASAETLNVLIADERSRQLWRAVAALPSGQRTAVMLYYRDEMPIGDIARVLGVTAGTIKTLLFRARRRLRERLHGELPIHQERST